MFKKFITGLIEQPLLASLFISDFFLLMFIKPPAIFSALMLGGLIVMCLYYGQKLALFKQ
jgi:hypothetical protein